MEPLKYHGNVKNVIVMVLLALILSIEPALAAKKSNKGGTSGKSSSPKRQAAKSSSAPRTQRQSNAGKAQSRAITSSRSSRSLSRPNISRPSSRGSSGRTIRSSVRSRSRAMSGRQSGNITLNQPVTSRPRITSGSRKPSNSSVSSRRTAMVNSSARERASANADNRISSSKTSRIVSRIETNRPTISKRQSSPAGSSNNRVSSDRTSRISGRVDTNRPTVSARQRAPAGSSGNRISSSKTSRIVSRIEANRPRASERQKSPNDRSKNRKNSDRISRITTRMGTQRNPRNSVREEGARSNRQNRDADRILVNNDKRDGRRADSVNKGPDTRIMPERRRRGRGSGVTERLLPSSRLRKSVSERQTIVVNNNAVNHTGRRGRIGVRGHRGIESVNLRYHDRPDSIRHVHRYEHVFRDWRNRLCHRIVWPRYRFLVHYRYGPWFTFRYVYPYYHRKYIFISLGGYWPVDYRYRRYYWYGCHPYVWSGYYPIAREVKGDTYNYYTYNYYNDDGEPIAYGSSQITDTGYITPVDHNTFADVREKLAQQAAEEPALPTPADVCFEDAVKAFEVDDYDVAIERFAKAIELAPEDVVLPFAYSQALFAKKWYSEAAEGLRTALLNVPPDEEGIFYPRGLYSDDNTLFEQIDNLAEVAELYSYDADLQLLWGYQLLGVGEIDEAVKPLQQASLDWENAAAANRLLNLLEKIKTENSEAENTNQ